MPCGRCFRALRVEGAGSGGSERDSSGVWELDAEELTFTAYPDRDAADLALSQPCRSHTGGKRPSIGSASRTRASGCRTAGWPPRGEDAMRFVMTDEDGSSTPPRSWPSTPDRTPAGLQPTCTCVPRRRSAPNA